MAKKYFLHKPIVIASNLSYKKAISLMEKANSSPVGEYVNFYVHGDPDETRWSVEGRVLALDKFIRDGNFESLIVNE